MKITTAWLKARGACDTERFRKRYPRGVTLSVKNVRATRVAWDWNWLAHKVFTPARLDQFAHNHDKAVGAYMKAFEAHEQEQRRARKRRRPQP